MIKCSFVKACAEFFGRKPGQTLADFAAELKALSPKDRADMIGWFQTVGYDVQETVAAAA